MSIHIELIGRLALWHEILLHIDSIQALTNPIVCLLLLIHEVSANATF